MPSSTPLGIHKIGFDDLRSKVITKLHTVQKQIKEKEEQAKTISATYSKSVKTRALPKISKQTWPKFLALWGQEQSKYSSDDACLSVLRQHLQDQNDILAAERLTDLASLNSLTAEIYFKVVQSHFCLVKTLKVCFLRNSPIREKVIIQSSEMYPSKGLQPALCVV